MFNKTSTFISFKQAEKAAFKLQLMMNGRITVGCRYIKDKELYLGFLTKPPGYCTTQISTTRHAKLRTFIWKKAHIKGNLRQRLASLISSKGNCCWYISVFNGCTGSSFNLEAEITSRGKRCKTCSSSKCFSHEKENAVQLPFPPKAVFWTFEMSFSASYTFSPDILKSSILLSKSRKTFLFNQNKQILKTKRQRSSSEKPSPKIPCSCLI